MASKQSSAAHRALGFLVPDRWREMRERQEQVASIPRLAAAMMSGIAQLEAMGSTVHGDYVASGLTEGARPALDAMVSIAGENLQRTPDKLAFSSVPDDEAVAAMSVHSDGSGAVLLSDSLISLIDYFAGLTICLADGGMETVEIAAVAVRYHVLHRRLFGLSALLGVTTPRDQEYSRGSLSELSLRFVLAHEHGLSLPPRHEAMIRVPSERNREMFRLRFIEGLTLTEVGRRTGVTDGRVSQLLKWHFGMSRRPPAVKARTQAQATVSLAVPPHTPAEWTILDLLLEADEQGLSVSELVWVIGSPVTVAEAIDALRTAGLHPYRPVRGGGDRPITTRGVEGCRNQRMLNLARPSVGCAKIAGSQ